ncbi:MAG: tripartite tricarboxylate transporter substrate binding protein, partial [Pseudolabrys sp.]
MTRRRHCDMINRLWNTFAAAALIAVTLIGADAWAQTSRTIRIVVPFPPGGSADILARLLGEHIAQGPTVIVENRPGGGASIAYEAV